MNPNVIYFLNGVYTWPEFILLLIGGAIVALLVSAISRLAYFSHRDHLLIQEIQKDLRKLVMIQTMSNDPKNRETDPSPDKPADPGQPPAT